VCIRRILRIRTPHCACTRSGLVSGRGSARSESFALADRSARSSINADGSCACSLCLFSRSFALTDFDFAGMQISRRKSSGRAVALETTQTTKTTAAGVLHNRWLTQANLRVGRRRVARGEGRGRSVIDLKKSKTRERSNIGVYFA